MQGTQVRSLVWEDSTCHGATKACAPQLLSLHFRACAFNKRSHCSASPCSTRKSSSCSPLLDKARTQHPAQPKRGKKGNLKKKGFIPSPGLKVTSPVISHMIAWSNGKGTSPFWDSAQNPNPSLMMRKSISQTKWRHIL